MFEIFLRFSVLAMSGALFIVGIGMWLFGWEIEQAMADRFAVYALCLGLLHSLRSDE